MKNKDYFDYVWDSIVEDFGIDGTYEKFIDIERIQELLEELEEYRLRCGSLEYWN